MRTALITTTINVPTVLELYRQHGPDVRFFVTGDKKTPQAAYDFCDAIPNCVAGRETSQIGWKCSDLIGWNCIQRRNIALLEAVKWGADIIVSIDDDNIPLSRPYSLDYFGMFSIPIEYEFDGIKVSSPTGWFDVGTLLDPIAPHRGFPHDVESQAVVSHVVGAKVGVAAGICLGDPDVSAVSRIALAPEVHRVSQLLESGIVVDPNTRTVFNSQNTAFIRELAPAMFMAPKIGRMDDIYASLIAQKTMQSRGLHVHFGKPFCWQQRNSHNLVDDLRAEIDGMENVTKIAECLSGISLEVGASVTEHTAQCYHELKHESLLPEQAVEAAYAFLEDVEGVL